MRRATRIAICLAIGFSPVDFARPGLGQVTLKHKFHEGTTSTVETSGRIAQNLTIAGTEIDTASDTKSLAKATVGKRDVEGKLRVNEKVESLQISITVMGQNYMFDSANPDNKGLSPFEVVRDVHKAIARARRPRSSTRTTGPWPSRPMRTRWVRFPPKSRLS